MAASKCLWSLSVLALAVGTSQAAPPAKKTQEKPEAVDITRQIRVELSEGLRSPEETTHEVFITLTNTSKTNLTGPIAVTFDGEKPTEFSFDWYTDTLKDGRQYYGLVDVDEILPPNQTSRRRKLYLKTAGKVTDAARTNPEVPLRVVRLSEEHIASKQPVDEQVAGKSYDRAEFDRVLSIQDRAANEILRTRKGIGAVALGENDQGQLVIKIMAERRGTARDLPGEIDGVPVDVSVSGTFFSHAGVKPKSPAKFGGKRNSLQSPQTESLPAKPEDPATLDAPSSKTPSRGQADPTGDIFNSAGFYPIPVPIGVSTSNEEDSCGAGTIGCRVVDRAGAVYALSNNHVYAALNDALIGDIICQPGPIDVFPRCEIAQTTNIANLSQFVAFRYAFSSEGADPVSSFNYVDAAIAITTPQNVDFQTPTGAYGVPSRSIVRDPRIGAPIQKMGRTTRFTLGFIDAINTKSIVLFANGTIPVYFDRAMVIKRESSGVFGDSGDSGSLVVYRDGNRPVGHYYAGSGIVGLMLPIDVTLQAFEVGIDDGSLDPDGSPLPFEGHKSGRMGIAVGPRNNGIAPQR